MIWLGFHNKSKKKGNVDNKDQAISNVMITSYTWHELVEKEKFCSFK